MGLRLPTYHSTSRREFARLLQRFIAALPSPSPPFQHKQDQASKSCLRCFSDFMGRVFRPPHPSPEEIILGYTAYKQF